MQCALSCTCLCHVLVCAGGVLAPLTLLPLTTQLLTDCIYHTKEAQQLQDWWQRTSMQSVWLWSALSSPHKHAVL